MGLSRKALLFIGVLVRYIPDKVRSNVPPLNLSSSTSGNDSLLNLHNDLITTSRPSATRSQDMSFVTDHLPMEQLHENGTKIDPNGTEPNKSSEIIDFPTCEYYKCRSNEFSGCYCDDICLDFGDCCHDSFAKFSDMLLRQNLTFLGQRQIYDDTGFYSDYPINLWGCVPDKYLSSAHWMITSCPNDTLNELCTRNNHSDVDNIHVDVFIDDTNMITFQNIFCANCHGFPVSDTVPWEASVQYCNITDPLTESTSIGKIMQSCKIQFTSKFTKHNRPCDPNIDRYEMCPSYTNPYTSEMLTLCRSYILPVGYLGLESKVNTVYKNPHCAACELGTTYDRKLTCEYPDAAFISKDNEGGAGQMIDLKIMFDLHMNAGTFVPVVNCDAKECDKKEVFDCLQKQCRPIVCLNGIVTADGTCSTSPREEDVIFYKPFDFGITSGTLELILCSAKRTVHPGKGIWVMVQNTIRENDDFTDIKTSESNDSNCLTFTAMTVNKPKLSMFVAQLLLHITRNERISEAYRLNISTYMDLEQLRCKARTDELLTESTTFQQGFDELITLRKHNQSVSINEGHWSLIVLDDSYMFEEFVTCKGLNNYTDLTCPSLEFSEDDIIIANGTARLINSSFELKPDEFQIVNGKLYICAHRFASVTPFLTLYDYPEYFVVVSMVSSALTVVSVVIIIGIHCIFKRLRNVYGLNITALSVVLLIMHVLLLFQQYIIVNKESCKALAATLHFILMSMFMWLIIIGFDMATMLRHHVVVATQNSASVFKKYVLVGLAIPFTITGSGLILDAVHSSFRPGFGENNRCWIAKESGFIAFVTVPVSLSLAVNFLLFVTSIVTIQKTKMSKTVRHTRGQTQYLTVYIKLVIILGFTWVLGLLSGFIKSDGLWMLHMVLNGLQGVSLLICLITNARIIRLVTKDVSKATSDLQSKGKLSSVAITED